MGKDYLHGAIEQHADYMPLGFGSGIGNRRLAKQPTSMSMVGAFEVEAANQKSRRGIRLDT